MTLLSYPKVPIQYYLLCVDLLFKVLLVASPSLYSHYHVTIPCIATDYIMIWSLYIIAADVDCTVRSDCAQGCAVVGGVEMCYCLPGYQFNVDAINCLGTYICTDIQFIGWMPTC